MPTTLTSAVKFRPQPYNYVGGTVETATYPEAASQTFKKNDILALSSGKLITAVAAGSLVTSAKIVGVALQDSTGVTDTQLLVAIANDMLRIVLPIFHTTPASAITAITQVGVVYDLRNDATGGYMVAIDSTSNPKVVVESIHPGPGTAPSGYAVGEQYGWAVCKFIQLQTEWEA